MRPRPGAGAIDGAAEHGGERVLAPERFLRRNLVWGVLGGVARLAHVVLLVVIGRWFGPEVLGRFVLLVSLFEIGNGVVSSGFSDGVALLVSRHAARGSRVALPAVARVVATGWILGGVVAVVLAIAVTLVTQVRVAIQVAPGPPMAWRLPLPIELPWLAWALLPALVARLALAATSGLLRVEWEAVLGAAGLPVALLAALPIVHRAHAGVAGLAVAFLCGQLALAIAGLVVLGRRVPFRLLGRAIAAGPRERALRRFAVPQGLNMAATNYLGRIDVLLLAMCHVPAASLGAYGAIAAVVMELRQIRMIASGALAVIVARQHALGQRAAMTRLLTRSAAWVASIALPVAVGAAFLRGDLLRLVVPAYQGPTAFIAVLLIGPAFNCVAGLAGNFLVYALRNRWNLANSLVVATLASALGLWLVPRFGLVGAAACSACGLAALAVLENLELARLEGARIAPQLFLRAGIILLATAAGLRLLDHTAAAGGVPHVVLALVAAGAAAVFLRPTAVESPSPVAGQRGDLPGGATARPRSIAELGSPG